MVPLVELLGRMHLVLCKDDSIDFIEGVEQYGTVHEEFNPVVDVHEVYMYCFRSRIKQGSVRKRSEVSYDGYLRQMNLIGRHSSL